MSCNSCNKQNKQCTCHKPQYETAAKAPIIEHLLDKCSGRHLHPITDTDAIMVKGYKNLTQLLKELKSQVSGEINPEILLEINNKIVSLQKQIDIFQSIIESLSPSDPIEIESLKQQIIEELKEQIPTYDQDTYTKTEIDAMLDGEGEDSGIERLLKLKADLDSETGKIVENQDNDHYWEGE